MFAKLYRISSTLALPLISDSNSGIIFEDFYCTTGWTGGAIGAATGLVTTGEATGWFISLT